MSIEIRNISTPASLYFDVVKVLMLLGVMLGHASALALPKFSEIDIYTLQGVIFALIKSVAGFGREAAFLFIFFSGYFSSPVFINWQGKNNLIPAFLHRIRRIYPTLIVALILTALIDWFGAVIFDFQVYHLNGFNYSFDDHYSLSVFILNLLSLQPTLSVTFGSNGPLWTLGYLVQSFFIGVLVRLVSGNSLRSFYVNVCMVAFLIFIFIGVEPALVLWIWLAGLLTRVCNLNIEKHCGAYFLYSCILFMLIFARLSSPTISLLMTPIIGLLIVMSGNNKLISKSFQHPEFVSRLSSINFALYAIHMPVFFFVFGVYQYTFDLSRVGDFHVFFYFVAAFVISITLAYVVYYLTNKRWVYL